MLQNVALSFYLHRAMISIYGLKDPETGQIRYVGKTSLPTYRLWGHKVQRTSKAKYEWVTSLKKKGLQPEFVIFEECHEKDIVWEREQFYIDKYKDNNLFNKNKAGKHIVGRIMINFTEEQVKEINERRRKSGHACNSSYIRGLVLIDLLKKK